jgi:hypothetical protein
MLGRLSKSLPLAPQEPAFSYMSRLAALNGIGAVDFAKDMGLGFGNVIAGKPETLRALAHLAGVSFDDLQTWTPTYIGNRNHLFRGERFHALGLHNTTIHGCPACLRNDAMATGVRNDKAMAIRAPWLVHHVSLCMTHNLPLVALWKLTAPQPRHDATARLRDIAPAILSGELDPPPREASPFDKWIWARLQGQRSDIWLDQFALHPATHFCELLGRAAYSVKIPRSKKFGRQHLHISTGVGFVLASTGERGVRSALTELQKMVGSPQDGPKKKFGDLYDRFAHELLAKAMRPSARCYGTISQRLGPWAPAIRLWVKRCCSSISIPFYRQPARQVWIRVECVSF